MDWIAIASGFGVGAIVGLTGVGGGSLMTPLLIGAFKLNPAVAIGTDLWFAAITKSGGAWAHHRHGHVDRRIALLLLAGSVPAAAATIAWMHWSGLTRSGMAALTWSLGVALLLTAITVAYRKVWHTVGLKLERWLPEHRKAPATVLCGLALGVLVSLSSIRRRRDRCHIDPAALPAPVRATARRHRHRPRRAAHAGGRDRARQPRPRRLAIAGVTVDRLAAWHLGGCTADQGVS
jgi:hypothetical protein